MSVCRQSPQGSQHCSTAHTFLSTSLWVSVAGPIGNPIPYRPCNRSRRRWDNGRPPAGNVYRWLFRVRQGHRAPSSPCRLLTHHSPRDSRRTVQLAWCWGWLARNYRRGMLKECLSELRQGDGSIYIQTMEFFKFQDRTEHVPMI